MSVNQALLSWPLHPLQNPFRINSRHLPRNRLIRQQALDLVSIRHMTAPLNALSPQHALFLHFQTRKFVDVDPSPASGGDVAEMSDIGAVTAIVRILDLLRGKVMI